MSLQPGWIVPARAVIATSQPCRRRRATLRPSAREAFEPGIIIASHHGEGRQRNFGAPDATDTQAGANTFGAGHGGRDGILDTLDENALEGRGLAEPEGAALAPIPRPAQQLAHRLNRRFLAGRRDVRDLQGDELAGVAADGGEDDALVAAPIRQANAIGSRLQC